MEVLFEWDEAKAESNFTKHGVSFLEARSAFLDPMARIFDDPLHSEAEPDRIRIISARLATKKERLTHEENSPRFR